MKFKKEYFIVALFIYSALLYISIDGVPLSHPGNLKAADPFYHIYATQQIVDTQQWNYYMPFVSLGQEKALSVQPPLLYMNAAMLHLFSKVPTWVTFYFLVSVTQAFFIIAVYLITNEVFEDKQTGFLAAAFSVLPVPVQYWLYGISIGFWIQVPAYAILLIGQWLFIKYIKQQQDWILFFMGLCISSIFLLHPTDIAFLILPVTIIGLTIIHRYYQEPLQIVKKALYAGLFPLVVVIAMLPRIFGVWGKMGQNTLFDIQYYGFSRNLFDDLPQNAPIFPHFKYFPEWVKYTFYIGALILVIYAIHYIIRKSIPQITFKQKENRTILSVKQIKNNYAKGFFWWSISVLFYFLIIYLTPAFITGPYYLAGRARALQPYFVFPIVAYLIVSLVTYIINKTGIKEMIPKDGPIQSSYISTFAVVIIALIVFFSAYGQYTQVKNNMSYEHISVDEWNAYVWLHENSREDARVLFFGNTYQAENLLAKRLGGELILDEVQRILMDYEKEQKLTTDFNVAFTGGTLRSVRQYEKTFFSYGTYSKPESNFSLFDFDYVFFQDIGPFTNINDFVALTYINEYGFKPVYDANGYMIIQNPNPTNRQIVRPET